MISQNGLCSQFPDGFGNIADHALRNLHLNLLSTQNMIGCKEDIWYRSPYPKLCDQRCISGEVYDHPREHG